MSIVTFILWMRRLRHREVNFPDATWSRKTEIEPITLSFQAQKSFYRTVLLSDVSSAFFFLIFNLSLRLLFFFTEFILLFHTRKEDFIFTALELERVNVSLKSRSNFFQRSVSPWLLGVWIAASTSAQELMMWKRNVLVKIYSLFQKCHSSHIVPQLFSWNGNTIFLWHLFFNLKKLWRWFIWLKK